MAFRFTQVSEESVLKNSRGTITPKKMKESTLTGWKFE